MRRFPPFRPSLALLALLSCPLSAISEPVAVPAGERVLDRLNPGEVYQIELGRAGAIELTCKSIVKNGISLASLPNGKEFRSIAWDPVRCVVVAKVDRVEEAVNHVSGIGPVNARNFRFDHLLFVNCFQPQREAIRLNANKISDQSHERWVHGLIRFVDDGRGLLVNMGELPREDRPADVRYFETTLAVPTAAQPK